MRYSEYIPEETHRFRKVTGETVSKTFVYSDRSSFQLSEALASCAERWSGVSDARFLLAFKSIRVGSNRLVVTQRRVRAHSDLCLDAALSFIKICNACHEQELVFGDLCHKNIVFDGSDFKVVDFEPFVKVSIGYRAQYRVTEPYFHESDRASGRVTYRTDRLALLGWIMRLKYGLRHSRPMFIDKADELSQVCTLSFDEYEAFARDL